jgi:hypothetical protein
VKAARDVEPRLEFVARLCFFDEIDEVVDPRFDRAGHLICACLALLEGDLRLAGLGWCVCHYTTETPSVSSASPIVAQIKRSSGGLKLHRTLKILNRAR